ncbi:hypothetical protein [Ottowia thiooxydans]|uniref:hypothetical protein n=1 Tax=Ottowia thiooxydans TaxID=219182 RepID=UPI0003FEFD16|nr:hypothetical protein [Ottowia thiooxydans]
MKGVETAAVQAGKGVGSIGANDAKGLDEVAKAGDGQRILPVRSRDRAGAAYLVREIIIDSKHCINAQYESVNALVKHLGKRYVFL